MATELMPGGTLEKHPEPLEGDALVLIKGAQPHASRWRQNPRHQAAARLSADAQSLEELSVERLMGFLTALGQDVEISVSPCPRG
jgi:hypothetical protein